MRLHIIHLPHRADRMKTLNEELLSQEIADYQIWDGIIDNAFPRRGISKAHKQIVAYAKQHKLPEVMIGEDDIHFSGMGALNYFLTNKPSDFDIYLGGVYYGEVSKENTVEDFSGLTLYIINARFYDIFLSLPEHENIDRALKKRGKYIVCDPFIVSQHNGYSDNMRKNVNYDHWLTNRNFYGST